MAKEMNAISNTSRERPWYWWVKWLFASWGATVGLYILLIILFMPVLGLSAAVDVLDKYRSLVMLILFFSSGLFCYRYLK